MNEGKKQNVFPVNRRGVLGGLAGFVLSPFMTGVSAFLDHAFSSKETQKENFDWLDKKMHELMQEAEDAYRLDSHVKKKYNSPVDYLLSSLFEKLGTVGVETMTTMIGSAITTKLLEDAEFVKKLGITFGNAGLEQKRLNFEKQFGEKWEVGFKLGFAATGIAPAFEEALMRKFPSNLLDSYNFEGNQMIFGIPLAILFSVIHGLKIVDPDTSEKKIVIHLPAILTGIYLWYLMRRDGYVWTVYSHSLMNMTAVTLGALQKYVNKKDNENAKD